MYTVDTEFCRSDYPQRIIAALESAGFHDCSWHNDACPSWTNDTLQVYVCEDDPQLREFPGFPQFMVVTAADGLELAASDDWNDIHWLIKSNDSIK